MIRDANESGSTEKASLPPIEGRVFNSQNPRYENKEARFDISNVDMQEGNMNNGEIGGGIKMESEVKEPFR